jgi:hypothetical protein
MVEYRAREVSDEGVLIVTPAAAVRVTWPAPLCVHIRTVPTGNAMVAFAGMVKVTALASVKFTSWLASTSAAT